MPSLSEAANELRMSKDSLERWGHRGLVKLDVKLKGNKRSLSITDKEIQRVKSMMYPYGLPANNAMPLNPQEVREALRYRIKTSWLPLLTEWGLLRAGRTPSGRLIINDAKMLDAMLIELAKVEGLFMICYSHTTRSEVAVQEVTRLLMDHFRA